MRNNFDADVVEEPTCDEVPVLFADCNSCSCCRQQFCCSEDSTDPNDPNCNYALDFYESVGKQYQCLSRGVEAEGSVFGCREIESVVLAPPQSSSADNNS